MSVNLFAYFKNLNGLRFIAAFLVIIHHIEQFKHLFQYPGYVYHSQIDSLGDIGVIIFFVLSGFLITYILLKEKDIKKDIGLLSFYMKRILRIWPLYFLVIILGLFVFNRIPFFSQHPIYSDFSRGYSTKILLFFLILPNIVIQTYGITPLIAQSWSIGVEEQFYLFWPLLMKTFSRSLYVIILVWFFSISATLLSWYLPSHHLIHSPVVLKYCDFIKLYLYNFKINCMAIGGIGAHILFYNNRTLLNIIYHKMTQITAYIAAIVILAIGVPTTTVNEQIISLVSIVIILNLSSNTHSLLSLENKILNYLGKISYGVYMFHPLCIFITLRVLFRSNLLHNNVFDNVFIYTISILLTILLSAASYRFYESKFLKLKPR
ncbi:MAG: acyltransferase 3 [Bacteroidota bacterium]|nr:acyltransferase 3 [Bacteroidota bacterium]